MIEVKPEVTMFPGDTLKELEKIYYAYKQCVSWELKDISFDSLERFIRKRMKGCHVTPLEQASVTFQVTCSRACSHQLVRHRLASYAQISQRYCEEQGDVKVVVPPSIKANPELYARFKARVEGSFEEYRDFIDGHDINREDARYLLHEATATRVMVNRNFRDLINFIGLRYCNRAQWEIKSLAEQMLKLMKIYYPCVFENVGRRCEQMGKCPEEDGFGCGWWEAHNKKGE